MARPWRWRRRCLLMRSLRRLAGTTTTSAIEYAFVVDPSTESLRRLGLSEWPKESVLVDTAAHGETQEAREAAQRQARSPVPLAEFEPQRLALCERLMEVAGVELSLHAMVGARLYTGPCFVK